MKNYLWLLSFITLSVMGLQSCKQDSMNEQLQIEPSAEELIAEYSAIYDNFSKSVFAAYQNDSQLNVENFANSYENNLADKEHACFYRILTSPSITRSGESLFPTELLDKLTNSMFDEDLTCLETEINAFYETPSFQQMNPAAQQELKIRLSCLINVRNSIADIL